MSNGNYSNTSVEQQPALGSGTSSRVDECRRLVADRYLMEGYVTHDQLNADGFISTELDPYVDHSEYFWSKNPEDEVEATIRVIKYPTHGLEDWKFPIERAFELDDDHAQFLDNVRRQNPYSIVEISALAKAKGETNEFAAIDMYKTIWQHAKRSNYEVCAISADERLDKSLRVLFGSAVQQIGNPEIVMGSPTVPSVLYPNNCARSMAEIYKDKLVQQGEDEAESYKSLINYLRDGLEPQYFTLEEKGNLADIGIVID